DQEARPRIGGGCEGAERGLFQSVGTQQQFWLAVRADGDGQMQRRPILAQTARALLSVLGALILVVLAASAEAEMKPIVARDRSAGGPRSPAPRPLSPRS